MILTKIKKNNKRTRKNEIINSTPIIVFTYYFGHISYYEGVSINNQPIPFPMDRDGSRFSCFVSIYVLYMGTKLHMYRVIL